MLTNLFNLIDVLQLSDVEKGGATVFPYIKVRIQPKKGAAAFWYNLHTSGAGEYLTRHAACPVLVGSKWGKIFAVKICSIH